MAKISYPLPRTVENSMSFGAVWYVLSCAFGCIVLIAAAVFVPMEFIKAVGFYGMLFLGFTQYLWVIPLAVYFFRKGLRQAGKGVLISSSILFAMTSICSAILLSWR